MAYAIREDATNKPWRPLPSRRLSQEQATSLMRAIYAIAFVANPYLGGLKQCRCLTVLGYCYNDLGGGDRNCILCKFINACGFVCFASGVAEVAASTDLQSWLSRPPNKWFLIIGTVVMTSIHTQDIYDQQGDRSYGPWTVPLSIGYVPGR